MASIIEQATGRAIQVVSDKVSNAIDSSKSPLLAAFQVQTEQECLNNSKQSNMFELMSKRFGLNAITGGLKDFFSKSLAESLQNSPLRKMAEDVLAENINKYSRTLSQNILNLVPKKITKTLTDIRSLAFNAVYSTMTLQNNMALYFTAKIAQECLKAIEDKNNTLITMRAASIRLHNALLNLTGAGPFFDQYLEQLKKALEHLLLAQGQLTAVQANYAINEIFLAGRFQDAKDNLDIAYQEMLPENETLSTKPDGSLLTQLLKGMNMAPSYKDQVTMLLQIPKFAAELLGSYDLYALKVIKVNTLLTGFLSSIQNLSLITQGKNKDLVLGQLFTAREGLSDIVDTMRFQLYGPTPDPNFKPNSALTSSKAVEWAVRTKSIRIMLDLIDPQAVTGVQISNEALLSYNQAVQDLELLNDRQSGIAYLKANAGREEVLDVEALVLAFAFQSNQAILSSSMLGKTKWDPKSVLTLGSKLTSRLQLSLNLDNEVTLILSQFIHENEAAIRAQRSLGQSIFNVLDDLGMDRAADFLKRGAFGEFFNLTGATASYIGAAVAGLSLLQKGLGESGQKECIERAIVDLKVKEVSAKLDAQTNIQSSFVKQQYLGDKKCKEAQASAQAVRACSSGIDINELFSNPISSLQGAFKGVFGGEITNSLESTFGSFGETVTTGVGDIPGQITSVLKGTSGVFTSVRFMADAIQNAAAFTGKLAADALKAVSDVQGSISGAVSGAAGAVSGAVGGAIGNVSGGIQGAVGGIAGGIQGSINDATKSLGTNLGIGDNLSSKLASAAQSAVTPEEILAVKDAQVKVNQAQDANRYLKYLQESAPMIDNPFNNLA